MAKRRPSPPNLPQEPQLPTDDPGAMATELAVNQTEKMGQQMTARYAAMGARWLGDAVPSRLDTDLIDRLSRQGFRKERLADIRVHRGPRAQAAADALDARAFAIGDSDVFFGASEYDPSTPEGRAVIAHEVAHVAPPTFSAATGAGAPALNERKKRPEQDFAVDHSDGEAEERVARDVEARVFAEESSRTAPEMPSAPASAASGPAAGKKQEPIDPQVLENKVMALLNRMQRSDMERSGQF